MRVVDSILFELKLNDIQCLKVFNKIDCVDEPEHLNIELCREGVVLSAIDRSTLQPFLEEAQRLMGKSLGWTN